MKLWTKKLTVPASSATAEIEAVQLWFVRWNARKGIWHSDLYPTMEAFTSQNEADNFALSLHQALRLLRSQDDVNITVTKGE